MYRGDDLIKIYDRDLNCIGTSTREEVHTKGLLHQVAHVWMFQWIGREPYIFIQKRSLKRDLYPGRYDLIQTTHFEPEESYEEGIRDSLDYYLGARLSDEDITHLATMSQKIDEGDYHDNAIVQVFAITVRKALFIMPETEEILKVRFDDFSRFVHGELASLPMYSLDDVQVCTSTLKEWWIRRDEFTDAVEPYIEGKLEDLI